MLLHGLTRQHEGDSQSNVGSVQRKPRRRICSLALYGPLAELPFIENFQLSTQRGSLARSYTAGSRFLRGILVNLCQVSLLVTLQRCLTKHETRSKINGGLLEPQTRQRENMTGAYQQHRDLSRYIPHTYLVYTQSSPFFAFHVPPFTKPRLPSCRNEDVLDDLGRMPCSLHDHRCDLLLIQRGVSQTQLPSRIW